MGRYEIILGKKGSSKSVRSLDLSNSESKTVASLWTKGETYAEADSPSDVVVHVNGQEVGVSFVNGVTGEIVLENIPDSGASVEVTYNYDRNHCYGDVEVFIVPPTGIFYVRNVPIVKRETIPKVELRSIIVDTGSIINVKATDIISENPIKLGTILKVDSEGRICTSGSTPIGVVVPTTGKDVVGIKLNSTPIPLNPETENSAIDPDDLPF